MSVDFSGNFALLGSRRHLTLINLNKPKEVLRRNHLNSKWDISKVKWNPFVSNQQYVLTTVSYFLVKGCMLLSQRCLECTNLCPFCFHVLKESYVLTCINRSNSKLNDLCLQDAEFVQLFFAAFIKFI